MLLFSMSMLMIQKLSCMSVKLQQNGGLSLAKMLLLIWYESCLILNAFVDS